MAQLIWKEARSQAQKLLRPGFEGPVPGDPYDICARLGITVHTIPLPSEVSGMIIKAKGSDAEIFLSSSDSEARRLFTCAHELGHFVERLQVARDSDFSFRDLRGSTKYDLHEFFADEFAGELLMPNPGFQNRLDQGHRSVDLAREYGVSVAAVEKRKERLRKNGDQPAR